MLSTQIAWWLQAALFENFEKKRLMKWWNREPWPCQEGMKLWLMLLGCSDGVRHQQCEDIWDANRGLVNTSLVLREFWWVVTVLTVSLPFQEKALGSGLLTSYHLIERRAKPAFLLGGGLEASNDLSVSRVNHSLCRCLGSESGWWLMFAYCGYPKIGWTAMYCHALGR